MSNEPKKKLETNQLLQLLQIVVIGVGLAGVFMKLGAFEQSVQHTQDELKELKDIAQDLVKSQVETASTDAAHTERIDALRVRVGNLERNSS